MDSAGQWSRLRGVKERRAPRHPEHLRGEELVRHLYQEHGLSLLAYATRLTGDRAAAEDVVQETLLRAWKHADSLTEERGSVRGWLLTVARNIVITQARARAARPHEVEQTPASGPVESDQADGILNSMVVLDALNKLSNDHRDVLIEVYYNDRSVAEAATRLGIPPGTVKSRTYYALRALRGLLAESDPEAPR